MIKVIIKSVVVSITLALILNFIGITFGLATIGGYTFYGEEKLFSLFILFAPTANRSLGISDYFGTAVVTYLLIFIVLLIFFFIFRKSKFNELIEFPKK